MSLRRLDGVRHMTHVPQWLAHVKFSVNSCDCDTDDRDFLWPPCGKSSLFSRIVLLWPPRGQLKLCHSSTVFAHHCCQEHPFPPLLIKIREVVFQTDLGGKKGAPGRWNRVCRGRKREARAGKSLCDMQPGVAACGQELRKKEGAVCAPNPISNPCQWLQPHGDGEGFSLETRLPCWGSVSICSFYCWVVKC